MPEPALLISLAILAIAVVVYLVYRGKRFLEQYLDQQRQQFLQRADVQLAAHKSRIEKDPRFRRNYMRPQVYWSNLRVGELLAVAGNADYPWREEALGYVQEFYSNKRYADRRGPPDREVERRLVDLMKDPRVSSRAEEVLNAFVKRQGRKYPTRRAGAARDECRRNAEGQVLELIGDALIARRFVEVDGKRLTEVEDLVSVMQNAPVGRPVKITIEREGKRITSNVVLRHP
jgi:hypothetical protein